MGWDHEQAFSRYCIITGCLILHTGLIFKKKKRSTLGLHFLQNGTQKEGKDYFQL